MVSLNLKPKSKAKVRSKPCNTKHTMDLKQRINAFEKLGAFIGQFTNDSIEKKSGVIGNEPFFQSLLEQITKAQQANAWFTKENILFALNGWHKLLTNNNLTLWTSKYTFNCDAPKTIAVVMAGNIPLVGFHDFLSVLITGHSVIVKQSSNDQQLMPVLSAYLEFVEPKFKGRITYTNDRLKNFDAVIATGSDNTARYFEYYFKNKPNIIRRNRNSVAVLDGSETSEELRLLSEDVFRYYGLGCRNVSKLFVPKGYDFSKFFEAMYHWNPIIHQHKYANNYDYNKAVYLMSNMSLLENGFLMLKEDTSFSSPIATLFYEYYDSKEQLQSYLHNNEDKLQCVVSNGFAENEIKFGQTQLPKLWDYADNVDTITFSLKIC